MTEPLTPREARQLKVKMIPEFVIRSFNELLAEKMTLSGIVRITQEEAVARIMFNAPEGFARNDLFNQNLLDVEPLYRKAGWSVTFEKGHYSDLIRLYTFKAPPGDE